MIIVTIAKSIVGARQLTVAELIQCNREMQAEAIMAYWTAFARHMIFDFRMRA